MVQYSSLKNLANFRNFEEVLILMSSLVSPSRSDWCHGTMFGDIGWISFCLPELRVLRNLITVSKHDFANHAQQPFIPSYSLFSRVRPSRRILSLVHANPKCPRQVLSLQFDTEEVEWELEFAPDHICQIGRCL